MKWARGKANMPSVPSDPIEAAVFKLHLVMLGMKPGESVTVTRVDHEGRSFLVTTDSDRAT